MICPFCSKEYSNKSNLNKHFKTKSCSLINLQNPEKLIELSSMYTKNVSNGNTINIKNLNLNIIKEVDVDDMTNESLHYIYVLREREFIKTNEFVYKIGKSTKRPFIRFNQ
jgi:hypothetical protein